MWSRPGSNRPTFLLDPSGFGTGGICLDLLLISRLESGRHKTSVETLQRVAEALGVRFILGFESGPREVPTRGLVSA